MGDRATTLVPAETKAQLLRSFDPADFPAITGREEEWRFTPMERLAILLDSGVTTRPSWGCSSVPAGVTCTRVSKEDPRIGCALTPFDKLSALAFVRSEVPSVLRIEPGVAVAEPVMVRALTGEPGTASYGHAVVEVGALSESTLVIEQGGAGALSDNVEVCVGDGARLTLLTLEEGEPTAVHAQHLRFRLGRDATVVHVQVALGGSLLRQYISVDYSGPGASFESYGIYFATANQHLEHRLLVDHGERDCRSYVSYRGALRGQGAHTVWIGDVLIRAQAIGTDTYEINRNLVLSDGARAESVPNLEIETSEVVGAGHASTTGRFDDEQLFYLMSRGIPEDQARTLVVRGFFAELLARVPVEAVRERLGQAIEERLDQGEEASL